MLLELDVRYILPHPTPVDVLRYGQIHVSCGSNSSVLRRRWWGRFASPVRGSTGDEHGGLEEVGDSPGDSPEPEEGEGFVLTCWPLPLWAIAGGYEFCFGGMVAGIGSGVCTAYCACICALCMDASVAVMGDADLHRLNCMCRSSSAESFDGSSRPTEVTRLNSA